MAERTEPPTEVGMTFFSHWRIWMWLSRSRKVTRNGIIQHLTSPPVLSQSVLLRTSAGASLPLLYHNGGNPSVHHLVRLKKRWITWWALWLHREYQQETWASSSSHTGVLQSTDCNPVFGTHNMKTCSLNSLLSKLNLNICVSSPRRFMAPA